MLRGYYLRWKTKYRNDLVPKVSRVKSSHIMRWKNDIRLLNLSYRGTTEDPVNLSDRYVVVVMTLLY